MFISYVSSHRTFKQGLSLVCLLYVVCLNVTSSSYATPRILRNGCSVVGVTGIGAFSLFVVIQFSYSCKYACCCLAAVSCLGYYCKDREIIGHGNTCVFGSVGVEMLGVHKLNKVRCNTEPFGTQFV